ncbi:MAG: hypothetical protein L0Y61_07650 [Epsilonproteobacteria bacterium]|nr:hypothetical protein [Campylobacterota bacterium]
MKKINITSTILVLGVLATSSLALETNQEVVYQKTCVKCHGANGEGNPLKKGPALTTKNVGDLQIAIMDLQGDMSINGGGSGDHDKMEHNLQVLEKKGYVIKSYEMSQFIYNSFNLKAKKK